MVGQIATAIKRYCEIKVSDLIVDEGIQPRFTLSEEAIDRYVEWFQERKKPPALKVWHEPNNGAYIIVDGFHRYEAAKRAGIEKLGCEILDCSKDDLLAIAYRFNRDHGVPLSNAERDRVIVKLRSVGKTQEEIGKLVGLTHNRVSQILASLSVTDELAKTRSVLGTDEQRALIKLLLKGEKQESLAKQYSISQRTVSNYFCRWTGDVQTSYVGGAMKCEVAEKFGLEPNEIDTLLRDYKDTDGNLTEALNFIPQESTVWPSFGIDPRFGKKHPGNVPALLVKNILCRLTKPGDLILDPFAGGGVVIDACKDMVNRACEAFDLTPIREDIKKWDILKAAPPTSRTPDLIFLDPPYGPQKRGEYSQDEHDLANMPVKEFLEAMAKVFTYWDDGWLVCLMTIYTGEGLGNYIHLPAETHNAILRAGWAFQERIINQIGRAEGTNKLTVSRLQKANEGRGWWSHRDDLEIIIGRKN